MWRIRKSTDRGKTELPWLISKHSFSFGAYTDPHWVGFHSLRVINQDWIAPLNGFSKHPHRDMEIITLIRKGILEHRDSMGYKERLLPMDIQLTSAGFGIEHEEINPDSEQILELFQIWIKPYLTGLKPSYQKQHFQLSENVCLVAPSGGLVNIHQDVYLYYMYFDSASPRTIPHQPKRGYYLHVMQGRLETSVGLLQEGDALLWENEDMIVKSDSQAHALFFDLL